MFLLLCFLFTLCTTVNMWCISIPICINKKNIATAWKEKTNPGFVIMGSLFTESQIGYLSLSRGILVGIRSLYLFLLLLLLDEGSSPCSVNLPLFLNATWQYKSMIGIPYIPTMWHLILKVFISFSLLMESWWLSWSPHISVLLLAVIKTDDTPGPDKIIYISLDYVFILS